MSDYNYIDMVRLCNKTAWEIADRREKKMSVMSDLISRRAVLKELPHALWGKEWDEALARAIIESVPTIDPAENGGCWGCCCEKLGQVTHGKWNSRHNGFIGIVFECSECGQLRSATSDWNYCPTCGARMDGE